MTALVLGIVLYGLAIVLLCRFVSINRRDEEQEERLLLQQLRESVPPAPTPIARDMVRVEPAVRVDRAVGADPTE